MDTFALFVEIERFPLMQFIMESGKHNNFPNKNFDNRIVLNKVYHQSDKTEKPM